MTHHWWHAEAWYEQDGDVIVFCTHRKSCGDLSRSRDNGQRCVTCGHPHCHPHMHGR